jgi:light-regulated signal transduction histidine kinase (bacteriophytochrome)
MGKMLKGKKYLSFILLIPLLFLYGCTNNNSDTANSKKLNEYKTKMTAYVQSFGEECKALCDYSAIGLLEVANIIDETAKEIDKASSYKEVDTVVDSAKTRIFNADIVLNLNAREFLLEDSFGTDSLVKKDFIDNNRTLGCFFKNESNSKIEIDNSSPEHLVFFYNDQSSFDTILNESVFVNFDSKMVVVLVHTRYINKTYRYSKVERNEGVLKINMFVSSIIQEGEENYNDATAPYPYQVVSAIEINKNDISAVEFNLISISMI